MVKNLAVIFAVFMVVGCGKIKKELRGSPGSNGAAGLTGAAGAQGGDGTSCSVAPVLVSPEYPNGGVVVTCGSDMVVVPNVAPGQNGQDGENGQDGAQGPSGANDVLAMIDPCGDASGVYDEVLLRLNTGQLLASFSDNANGLNTRFSVIGQGSYVTTDGSHCHFSVDSSGNVNW